MPRSWMRCIAGWLCRSGGEYASETVLFHYAFFSTLMRPSALMAIDASCVIPPASQEDSMYYVLVVSPMELEVSTKTGYFDQTIALNGPIENMLGPLMHELTVRKLAAA